MAPRKKPVPEPEPASRALEGFDWHKTPNPRAYGGVNLKDEPAVFNGTAYVYRYRVTVERIEEPVHVVAERMAALYRATDNSHHRTTLTQEARRLGVDLQAVLAETKEKSK